MKSSRSSVRRTSAQASAVIKTGRSLLAGKTKALSIETTSSTSEILERKPAHVAVVSKGNLERFFQPHYEPMDWQSASSLVLRLYQE